MRYVLLEDTTAQPARFCGDVCAVDDSLQCDADSLTLAQGRFPGFCPYHVVHNLLGGHYSRHPQCTASPFADVTCRYGSHSRPGDAQEQRTHCPAVGSVVFLPLGLSCRAGCPGSLVVGCVECQDYGSGMACAACGRLWPDDEPEVANADAIWTTIHHHTGDCECGACPPEGLGSDGGGAYTVEEDRSGGAGPGETEEGAWEDEEEGEDEEEWYDEEEQDGEEGWAGEEERGGEGEEEAVQGEPDWGDGRWEQTSHGYAWVVDYRSRGSAPAPAPESSVADVAAVAARAAVAALESASSGASAGGQLPATDADWQRRVRVLELERELEDLRRAKRVCR